MAVEARPELVGKRFLCVSGEELPELGEIGRWGWRAGVIRAVTHRDNDNPELTVYVEFDDLEWDKREWVKVYEDFQIFLLEHQLVWAKWKETSQPQGTKSKQIQWPALTFKPLVGKAVLDSITAVEFFADKHLDFLSGDGACQPYQDEVDSLNPVLRDNPQLHEEVKAWVKEQKVQEIFMQGPYSLNGYRVRVYRQDSATQWFTGIITHHDLFSRTMIVMNDQVLEPQNVDPSMVQMTFLDDVVHSLLKGENIGITSRRRSRSSQNSNTAHGHYTRAQANSPRPVMNSPTATSKQVQQQQQQTQQQQLQQQQQQQQHQQLQQQQQRISRSSKRKGSDSSVPDEDKIKEERLDNGGRGEFSKKKNKQIVHKRKPEDDEKKGCLKRLKADNVSEYSESSDSENSNKRIDSSSEQNSENEFKSISTSKASEEEEKFQSNNGAEEQNLIDRHYPWDEIQRDEKTQKAEGIQSESPLQPAEPSTFYDQNASTPDVQGCIVELKSTVKNVLKDHYANSVSQTPTPKCVIDITEDNSNNGSRETAEAVSALQTSQSSESYISESRHLMLNPSGSDVRKPEFEQQLSNSIASKIEFAHSEVIRTVAAVNDSAAKAENDKASYTSIISCISKSNFTDEGRKLNKLSPSPDVLKLNSNPEILKPKSNHFCDSLKPKHQNPLETSKPKPNTSPDVSKHKIRYQESQISAASANRPAPKAEPEMPRSSFKPVPARINHAEATKSPLIIDRNEHFTVYRDPALFRPDTENNHVAFLHQHLHPLHASSHATCLTPNNHHPTHLLPRSSPQAPMAAINAHALSSAPHHSVHHPHLLPTVLPGMPAASLLGGHPRLDSGHSSSLSHLALAQHQHHQHQQQQQFLQHQQPPPHLLGQTHATASYSQLGLYPIIWQYQNGSHSYPGLGMPSSKWVHPENAVNSEASLRRNTHSPWLPVTSADSLGLLSHIPVRPASADPHRPIRLHTHASPPLSKAAGDHHKEDLDKKVFIDPMRVITPAHLKSDQDHSRTQAGKESIMHRHLVDSISAHCKQLRPPQEIGDRINKYKEENHMILQESIEVAPFTAKIKSNDVERDSYPRIPPLPTASPKNHVIKQDDIEHSAAELYKFKHSVPQTLPQSSYFTTLSTTVVNEPPRLYPSKEAINCYVEKLSSNHLASSIPLTLTSFNCKSLSKPPPLIKHQPEGEGLVGKITEQLSQQVASHVLNASGNERRSPAMSPSNPLRCMPALHRAPVFHPPTPQTLDRKEGSYGRLSPPTLTPIQPVSAAGKISELQKPPTLLPELRDVSTVCKNSSEITSSEIWKVSDSLNHEKPGWHLEKSNGKPQAATASVIVRPPTCMKYDGLPGPKSASKESVIETSFTGTNRTYCLKLGEGRESGRVILPNTNLEDTCTQYKNNFQAISQGSIPSSVVAAANTMCNIKTHVTASAATTTGVLSHGESDMTYFMSTTVSTNCRTESSALKSGAQSMAELQDNKIRTTSPSTFLPSTGSTTQASAGLTYTASFVHLKKHKAALAAAQSRSSNANESEPINVKIQKCSLTISQDSTAVNNTMNKTCSLTNGQPAQSSQPNYHTKLKKAWLTRHSEEDKNTNKTEKLGSNMSEIIKPCTVSLIASTSSDVENNKESKEQEDQLEQDEKKTRTGTKRTYESGSESDDSDESDSKAERRAKRQPKPTYKKKQNDMQKKKGDNEREDEEVKPNGIFRSAREKTKLKLASSNGIPRSVLKDWRKVKKLKQTGESFLQDDSCSEIGPNLRKCRECRVFRNKRGEEPAPSPVFCRFYYFRRLSFSKNGVVRIDGFSSPDQYDDEAISLWAPDDYEDNELDLETSKYILGYIGDKFCQLVTSENTATTWIKKDAKIAWKRAVRGVREMCDACEATLFNIHWVCQKCGFVVCLDCYKAKERKSSKELYAWMKCVKGQPHDHKHLMPTQIIPGTVLTDLVDVMHTLRDKYCIKSHCPCAGKQNIQLGKHPATNGVSQVLQNVLNHSNKISLCKPEFQQKNATPKLETNGSSSPGSNTSTDNKLTPPESQSPLHFLADLAEQKAREEKKENKESPLSKQVKEEKEQTDSLESLNCKSSSLVANSNEQGSTLRDLLTTTAGKLRLGCTDAGIAFAPVYSSGTQTGKGIRSIPNILDDIIASVVENKIPANRTAKLNLKHELSEENKHDRKKSTSDESSRLHSDIPHSWLCDRRLLWLKDHRNCNNWKLFRECWKQGQPVLVSGVHKKLNANLWKAESFNQEFADHQGDLLNCKDGVVSNSSIKEFWDGFEDLTKRLKSKDGETMVYRLKDWPSGEEFMALMPSRYDDLMRNLPLPEYSDPEGKLNLASRLPTFFVRPDLGPRLCCAYGVTASKEHDFGTANLHLEVSDIVNVLVYVGVAKGNGVLSKTGVLKRLEEEDLDENMKKRLKDSTETPGALWHIYGNKDAEKIKDFLQKAAKEQGLEVLQEHDPIRDQNWYLTRKLRQRLYEEHGVQGWTVVQFLGDSVIIPAGAIHQVQNLHSCVQVINDFVSPEHVVHSFHLTQELRSSKEEVNYEDKLQVKNIYYHTVKDAVGSLKRFCDEELEDTEEHS
ncbi:probable JmjC domain-containing histone demethylation protein 2C isoform X2 [Polyodon spathula]|uniref:probable JmjC domain-containing histone demethylation protein 2C isoform X2 n=1 Tax=Polyodon spathula TaxID=7913 RepID=UPI001B7E0848|nr:probable JmjC domain-containing histone demethylation protein 2C isoform X2 [Polyodon spathula]